MLKPEQVPDEVVEASCLRLYKMKTKDIKAAIALAINAWPGMHYGPSYLNEGRTLIILHLPPKENANAKT